jgi:hypothetical protein
MNKYQKKFDWPWQQVLFFVMIGVAILSLVFVMKGMNSRISSLEQEVDEVRALALMPK